MKRHFLPTLAAAVLLSTCAKPPQIPRHDFQVPAPPEIGSPEAAAMPPADPEWWTYLDAPGLDAAVRRARDCSPGVRAARERLGAALQEVVIARAASVPELSVGANRLRQRQNFVGLPFPGLADRVLSNTFSNSGLSFNISWEADLWKRVAAGKLGAETTVLARGLDVDWLMLSVTAQVAKAWFAAVEAGQQVGIADSLLAHDRVVLARTLERYRSGRRSPVDVRIAEAAIERSEATVHQRRQALDALVRQVEVLTCEVPAGNLPVPRQLAELSEPVPPGLSSEVLYRRPDLASAEREIFAADTRIIQAQAALKPSFSLTTALGTSSNTLLDLVNPGLQVWNYALGFAQPLFNRGRLQANVRVTEARAREAVANYESRVWTAYLEVETALASEASLRDQEVRLRAALGLTEQARAEAESRYEAGLGDLFAVLNLQRSVLESESGLLSVQRAIYDNRVDLHLAIGGGFGSARSDATAD